MLQFNNPVQEPEDKEEMKKQNKKMFYYRDLLEKGLKKKELEALLEHNNQEIPVGQVTNTNLNIFVRKVEASFLLLSFELQ